ETHLETSAPLRAVEDDHVDRPGVEAPQGVELTGTNSSIGLFALIMQCSSWPAGCKRARKAVRADLCRVVPPEPACAAVRANVVGGPACGRPVCFTPSPTW